MQRSQQQRQDNEYGMVEISALKRQKEHQKALDILREIAASVRPLMIKRKWRVPNFSEFHPSNPNLLGININRGWHIKIRLRYNNAAADEFIDRHDLIGTTLHELTHNVHSAHDDKFYRYLDELYTEWEKLTMSGLYQFTDTTFKESYLAFTGTGHRLGSNASSSQRLINRNGEDKVISAKDAARAATLKRFNIQVGGTSNVANTRNGGYILGGSTCNSRGLDQLKSGRELAVQAALRRIRDDRWCSNNTGEIIYIDLTQDSDDDIDDVDNKKDKDDSRGRKKKPHEDGVIIIS
ncbi:hypothetical protein MIR68_001096 [Amoeboaphelidium protococcarum]|nr:hypothetical protein MIR68_001096 [Amoeboaphelidium protococcarum]